MSSETLVFRFRVAEVMLWCQRVLDSTAPDADPSQVYPVEDAREGLREALEALGENHD